MAYGDEWERDTLDRLRGWQEMRWRRESEEEHLPPDERLDEVGWDIYFGATRAMGEREAAALALDGTFRDRVRVRDDLLRRHRIALEQRYEELHPAGPGLGVTLTTAPEQLTFWTERLTSPTFVYFMQSGEEGPIKIGISNRPQSSSA